MKTKHSLLKRKKLLCHQERSSCSNEQKHDDNNMDTPMSDSPLVDCSPCTKSPSLVNYVHFTPAVISASAAITTTLTATTTPPNHSRFGDDTTVQSMIPTNKDNNNDTNNNNNTNNNTFDTRDNKETACIVVHEHHTDPMQIHNTTQTTSTRDQMFSSPTMQSFTVPNSLHDETASPLTSGTEHEPFALQQDTVREIHSSPNISQSDSTTDVNKKRKRVNKSKLLSLVPWPYKEVVDSGPHAMYLRYNALLNYVMSLRVKEKRRVYVLMRNMPNLTVDVFFPHHGFTAGEFSFFQVISEQMHKEIK